MVAISADHLHSVASSVEQIRNEFLKVPGRKLLDAFKRAPCLNAHMRQAMLLIELSLRCWLS